MINIGQRLTDDEASREYEEIIATTPHTATYLNDADDDTEMILETNDERYEVNFQYHDDIACFIQRIG